jgi:hypothetical protein
MLLVCVASALPAVTAGQTLEPRRVAATYDVYAGGLHALELNLELTLAGDRYDARAKMRTRGMMDWLFGWQAASIVSGKLDGLKPQPERYEVAGEFRGRPRKTLVTYRDGTVANIAIEPVLADDNDREPVPPEMLAGTRDPVSTVLLALTEVAANGRCEARYAGFDGRRRYDIEFTDQGVERVEAGNPPVFAGEARRCAFVYRNVAGFVRRASWTGQERQREPQTGRAWVASTTSGMPHMPVKIEYDTGFWGKTFVQLRGPVPQALVQR